MASDVGTDVVLVGRVQDVSGLDQMVFELSER